MTDKQLWYDRHRPTSIDDYVFVDDQLKKRVETYIAQKSIPHLMLIGPPGVGKTSLARLLCSALVRDRADLLALNASLHNNVETVQSQILAFCESGGWSGTKIVFLDEFDRFTRAAQQTLRGMIDQYGDTVRFITTVNYPHLIIEPLRESRFRKIEITALDYEPFMVRLLTILVTEGVEVDDTASEVIEQIVRETYPDMRAAIGRMEDQTFDGKLTQNSRTQKREAPWEAQLVELLAQDAAISHSRAIIDAVRRDELPDAYKYLYDHVNDLFDGYQDEAVMVIDSYMRGGEAASYPNITLCACLIQLKRLRKANEAGQ